MQKPDKLKIDWNGVVTLRPTTLGWYILDRYYRDIGMRPPEHGDTLEIELWNAANIFGDKLHNGFIGVFESTEMEYRVPK